MYNIQFILDDYRPLNVDIEEEDLNNFLSAIQQKKPYFDSVKGVGFWLPPENIKYATISKKLTQHQEEPCQNNQNWEVDNASQS